MAFNLESTTSDPIRETWLPISQKKLAEYRLDFASRHRKLISDNPNSPDLNFESDIDTPILLNMKFFNTLIQQATLKHYFVAHFICDAADKNYKNLNIAICIKEKGAGVNGNDEIRGKIYDVSGKLLEYNEFNQLRKNYDGRRKLISSNSTAFSSDREGRAHEITESMQLVVNKIALKTEYMYVYFILDDYNEVKKNLSVAFSPVESTLTNISLELAFDDDGDAYDHGGACCPI